MAIAGAYTSTRSGWAIGGAARRWLMYAKSQIG
jgi:hypothetical protein